MMKVDRPQGPLHSLFELRRRTSEFDRADAVSATQLETDAGLFESKLTHTAKQDDEATPDDDQAPPSPFDLFQKPPARAMADAEIVSYQAVSNIVRELVSEIYVSDDNIADRRVNLRLADHVLPGVMLSIQENEGRINVDFTCSTDPSRACLCKIAPRLSTELANQLYRDTRVMVRSDDPEDANPFQVDATPSQARQEGDTGARGEPGQSA